jgi:hypothetical protein
MSYVIGNGKGDIDDGRFTGEHGGVVLRHRADPK